MYYFAFLILVSGHCMANLTNITVRVNYFISEDPLDYMPTFDDDSSCNCTILHNQNILSLKRFMGIVLIDTIITDLEENDIRDLPNLRELSLSSTTLTKISPGSLAKLPNLRYFFLENNKLTNISNGVFDELKAILLISLKGNKIDTIGGDAFAKLATLMELDLSQNEITEIDLAWFKGLVSLENLNLSYNKLDVLPDFAFQRLRNLQHLYLVNNKIHRLEGNSLDGLNNLNLLDLSNNKLTSIGEEVFQNRGSTLRELLMCGNHFECNTAQVLDQLLDNLDILAVEEIEDCSNRLDSSRILIKLEKKYYFPRNMYFHQRKFKMAMSSGKSSAIRVTC